MNSADILVNFEEIDRYEESLKAFLNNEIDADRFQSMRLQQGVYGQRQEGLHMIRIKIPGGALNPDQLDVIANVLEKYADHDVAHITTRQDFQVHYIPLKKTPAALKDLANGGLTSREACNNTVRNISACPLADVCPKQHTNILSHVDGAVKRFLRHPLTQHLPRKFKISFSACETDCAQAMIHDIGVVATHKDGEFGFKVFAGGGLGHKPREAIVVEEFIKEKDLLACMEAIITLHNRFSDRKKRAKSRIKFLVDKFGAEDFVKRYKEEYERTLTALADYEVPTAPWQVGNNEGEFNPGAPRTIIKQKDAVLNLFPISVPIGDLTGPQMHGLAQTMKKLNLNDLRVTQDQNIVIAGVQDESVEVLKTAVADLGLNVPQNGDDVVACPGTSTCRLGITSSKIIGAKLTGGKHDLRIRASGCHNGCAQPETGDIGIYGEGKRKFGKLVPHYRMYLGGDGRGNKGIGFKAPTIPAARIEGAINCVQNAYNKNESNDESFFDWSRNLGAEHFNEMLKPFVEIDESELNEVINDHGDVTDFKVLQLGGGECAGAAQETVAANFADAANERNYRYAFFMQRKYPEAIECAEEILRKIGQSLLFLAGEPSVDSVAEISEKVSELYPKQENIGNELSAFSKSIIALSENFDVDQFSTLSANIDQWTTDASIICQEIDAQLDLSASVPKTTEETEKKKLA